MSNKPANTRTPLTGVLFDSDPDRDYELFGFVRVGGMTYKVFAWREDRRQGQRRWALKLMPHTGQRIGRGEECAR